MAVITLLSLARSLSIGRSGRVVSATFGSVMMPVCRNRTAMRARLNENREMWLEECFVARAAGTVGKKACGG